MKDIPVLDILMIIGGFVLLIKGADLLVSGAASVAKRMRVSDVTIGLTVVAMGTSAPELLVNVLSGSKEEHDLVFGNIIGSNIFNLFLILGMSSVIFPMTVSRSLLIKDVPYCTVGLLLLLVLVNDSFFFPGQEDVLSFTDGLILLTVFAIFLAHTFINVRRGIGVEENDEQAVELSKLPKSILFIILGVIGLASGGHFVVTGAISIADAFHVSKKIIGLTILAGGTSLPELATSCVAAFNRKGDLAVGNIIGSNIFNILMVLGVTVVFSTGGNPLRYNADPLNEDMLITLAGMGLLVIFMYSLKRRKVDRIEGAFFLLGFLGYAYLIYTRLQ